MKNFTFGILAYKHEEYIIEHLESIKYQVTHYAGNINCHLVISDDCSPDNTVSVARKWIDFNKDLFKSVQIITAEKNQGIVKNMTTLLKNIKTEHCKILAGDDLYYKNNVFTVFSENDVVITPVYGFYDMNNPAAMENHRFTKIFYELFLTNDIVSFVKSEFQYGNIIPAPGMFYKSALFNEQFLTKLAKEYSWIEDLQMWHFIFHIPNVKVAVLSNIFVLYRLSSGISNSKNHARHLLFKEEEKKLKKDICIKNKFPYTKLHRLKISIKKKVIKYYFVKRSSLIQEYEAERLKVQNEIMDYLRYISAQVDCYNKLHKL